MSAPNGIFSVFVLAEMLDEPPDPQPDTTATRKTAARAANFVFALILLSSLRDRPRFRFRSGASPKVQIAVTLPLADNRVVGLPFVLLGIDEGLGKRRSEDLRGERVGLELDQGLAQRP